MNVLAVLVIYNRTIEESDTFKALLRNYANAPDAFRGVKLLVYDNSAEAHDVAVPVPFQWEYVHDECNRGLAVAYNRAWKEAVRTSCRWLLLLDQDSSLPDEFMRRLSGDLLVVDGDSRVAAVVPKMRSGRSVFSPARVFYGGIVRSIGRRHEGICAFDNAFAIGSGCAIRVSFLNVIGGFNETFRLDCLDRWLFLMIGRMGGRVYVSRSIVDHELSVMDFDRRMTEERYRSILEYEAFFMDSYASRVENWVFYLRLIKRAVSLYLTVREKKYSWMTLSYLLELLGSGPRDLKVLQR